MSEEEDNISEMDSETDLEGGTEIPMGLLDEVGEFFSSGLILTFMVSANWLN